MYLLKFVIVHILEFLGFCQMHLQSVDDKARTGWTHDRSEHWITACVSSLTPDDCQFCYTMSSGLHTGLKWIVFIYSVKRCWLHVTCTMFWKSSFRKSLLATWILLFHNCVKALWYIVIFNRLRWKDEGWKICWLPDVQTDSGAYFSRF